MFSNSALRLTIDGLTCTLQETAAFPGFAVEITRTPERFTALLIPARPLQPSAISLTLPYAPGSEDRVLVNGYQSWTDTHEHAPTDRMRGMSLLARSLEWKYRLSEYGDFRFTKYPNRPGHLQGWTYGYVRTPRDEYTLYASLSEAAGFTALRFDLPSRTVTFEKDCAGLTVTDPLVILDVCCLQGAEKTVFDRWFELLGITPLPCPDVTGYTSWYRRYQAITEETILEDLTGIQGLSPAPSIFQIDDGWEPFIGDWLTTHPQKFPNGIRHLTDRIHDRGLQAGLWLAPFVAEKDSELFKNHPDWIMRDPAGKIVDCGCNWSGFYALDWEQPAVIAYLTRVFDNVFNNWGFDMVKLDFLYAACKYPKDGRTRGQRMAEAMDLLRRLCGDHPILGCGVPLVSAFGKVNYCRIGPDVGLDWDDKPIMKYAHRERVSTRLTILNTICRRQLDKRAFGNDPDVCYFRDDTLQLTADQKRTLSTANGLFGSLRFISDNAALCTPEALLDYTRAMTLRGSPAAVSFDRGRTAVRFERNGKQEEIGVE